MAKPTVISREYKVMLRAARFRGDEEALRRTTRKFLPGVQASHRPGRHRLGRLILFYDTAGHLLYKNGYIFRERRGEPPGDREVTLKFRHPDGYLAQDRDMAAGGAGHGTTKLEEDIRPRFETFSASRLG